MKVNPQVSVDSDNRPRVADVNQAQGAVVRWWTVLVGLLLLIPNSYFVTQMEIVRRGPYPTTMSIFGHCVLELVLLILINAFLKSLFRPISLNRAELLTIYSMLCIGSALAGLDMIPILVQTMAHPAGFASDANGWMGLFGQYLPRDLMVLDQSVIHNFYRGNDTLYKWTYLGAWLPPVLRWCSFIFCLMFVMYCITVLLRKQWVERERLTFPIVILPLKMTEEGNVFWRNGFLWAGIAIAGGIEFINGLHTYIPTLPMVNVGPRDLMLVLTQKSWNAMGWTPYTFYPIIIGLGYLLPLDLVFSCWFFYIFWKMQMVITSAMGWDATPQFPFIAEQDFGAYLAITVMLIWTSRNYIKSVWQRAWRNSGELDDSEEGISYRTALIGMMIGVLFLIAFLVHYGMSPVWAVLLVLIYLAVAIAITRMRAELGAPIHDLHHTGADHILPAFFGSSAIGGRSLSMLSLCYWMGRAYRGHPMPLFLEGQRMASIVKSSQRRMVTAMMLAVLVGSLSAFWAFLSCAYKIGGAGAKFYQGIGFGNEAYTRLGSWIASPTSADPHVIWASIVGFVSCAFLMFMRLKFYWWPFHPIGYAISATFSMNLVWLPLLIAWVIKLFVLRYGSLKSYKRFEPFFLGLMIGGFVVGCLWSLIGIIFHAPTYCFWGT